MKIGTKLGKNGFTVIELLVGAGIFLLVFGGAIGSLVHAFELQRRILETGQRSAQIDFALEFMSRALKFAKKERRQGSDACLPVNYFYDINQAENKACFINRLQSDACQCFFLENGQIKYDNGQDEFPLTTASVFVDDLKFSVTGQGTDLAQPCLTVLITASGRSGESTPIYLQTTITPRYLDVPFGQE